MHKPPISRRTMLAAALLLTLAAGLVAPVLAQGQDAHQPMRVDLPLVPQSSAPMSQAIVAVLRPEG
jgi:hypothetical protein